MSTKLNAYVSDVMGRIVESVIEAMQNGTAPWQRPWHARVAYPTNIATGNEYNGLNALYLMLLGAGMGSDYWVGYKQAQKLGGRVKKSEAKNYVCILAPMVRKGEDKNGDEYRYVAGFRVARVYNVTQCEGIELPELPEASEHVLNATMLDEFFANTGADIRTGGERAYYNPSQDFVQIPAREQFKAPEGYYGTVLHELVHWTGHKSRLDRLSDKSKRGYAFEELIAELGAYFASIKLDCPNEAENHESYLAGWLKALSDDPRYLWDAASQAERAVKYLLATAERQAEAA